MTWLVTRLSPLARHSRLLGSSSSSVVTRTLSATAFMDYRHPRVTINSTPIRRASIRSANTSTNRQPLILHDKLSVLLARELSPSATSTVDTHTLDTNSKGDTPLLMGCVCYDVSVADIWDGLSNYLNTEANVPFDYVLYSNYEQQVAALLKGHIDIAWNGPLAHVLLEEAVYTNAFSSQQPIEDNALSVVSLGMRDVDCDFESVLVTRNDRNSKDWQSSHVVTGSIDSPQAHVVPLYYLQQHLQCHFASVTPFNVDLGKHGDTAIGEVQALKALVEHSDTYDMAIVSKMMWERACQGLLEGIDVQELQNTCQLVPKSIVSLPTFDHCQFDALITEGEDETSRRHVRKLQSFGQALFQMDYDNNEYHRHLMTLEGIQKSWAPPRQDQYDIVRQAMANRPGSLSANVRGTGSTLQRASNLSYSELGVSQQSQSARAFSTASSGAPIRVAVVGAGVAGLQAIRALQNTVGLDVTAFESSSRVGGLWQSNYANFGVQVPKQLYEFQDYPMTEQDDGVAWGDYASGPQVQNYIERYANVFGLTDAIKFNSKVTRAAPKNGESGGWTVETTSGKQDFDYLVMATGLYSNVKKNIPTKPNQEAFCGEIMHSSDFTNAAIAKDQRVVVIGSGKSAVDCAIQASHAGASSVTLLQRTAHWPTPQKIAGVIPFQNIFLSRFGQALVSAHQGTFPYGSGDVLNAFRNSGIGPLLMKPIFRIVEELFAFQFGLKGDLRPKEDVVRDFYEVALVLDSEFKELRKAGKINARIGEIQEYPTDGGNVLALKDGSSLDADLVVSATGFTQDYSILDPGTVKDLDLQNDGMYLYRYILPEKVPNMAFIGHAAAISNISSYGLQAEWLARNLTGQLTSGSFNNHGPSASVIAPEYVAEEIQARKRWARSWMPECGNRGMNILLHQTHYHDLLLRDMGMNPLRKSNPLAEYLMPYEPADYNGVMRGSARKDYAAEVMAK